MKGQDILVLLGMLRRTGAPATLAELSESLDLSVATIHRGLIRLRDAGLVTEDRQVQLAQLDEFLAHALRYLFPPQGKGESRGVATAWAAPPLRDRLASASGAPPVWPHPRGETRGITLEPLHPVVPDLALRDEELYERLALVEALRLGDARVRNLARDELRRHYSAAG